jgi:hypothetical protein
MTRMGQVWAHECGFMPRTNAYIASTTGVGVSNMSSQVKD